MLIQIDVGHEDSTCQTRGYSTVADIQVVAPANNLVSQNELNAFACQVGQALLCSVIFINATCENPDQIFLVNAGIKADGINSIKFLTRWYLSIDFIEQISTACDDVFAMLLNWKEHITKP